MKTKYEVGDKVLLQAIIERIEILKNGIVLYHFKEGEVPVTAKEIIGRIK